jgi:hypothetical protein
MATKQKFVPEISESQTANNQEQASTKNDSINTVLFFNAIIALITIVAVFIMVK